MHNTSPLLQHFPWITTETKEGKPSASRT